MIAASRAILLALGINVVAGLDTLQPPTMGFPQPANVRSCNWLQSTSSRLDTVRLHDSQVPCLCKCSGDRGQRSNLRSEHRHLFGKLHIGRLNESIADRKLFNNFS